MGIFINFDKMSSIGTGYDLYTSQFSPDGRVFQVEYAHKAVENSGTAIALRGKDGVVFAVEKIVTSKLYEKGANKRIFNVDRHVGMAASGLYPDTRQLAETAANEAANYRADYGTEIPLAYLADRVSMYMHAYTLYSAVRPFGATVMFGSYTDLHGPKLYCIEPSGTSYGYWGCAGGKDRDLEDEPEGERVQGFDQGGRQNHLPGPRRGQGQDVRARTIVGHGSHGGSPPARSR